MIQSMEEYMEAKRKYIDAYVEGEHKWYGDTSVSLPSLSCYNPLPTPWYAREKNVPTHNTVLSRNPPHL
jgi:hypothetical protein